MRLRSIIAFSLLTVILLVGCAPTSVTVTNPPEIPVGNEPTVAPLSTATMAQPEQASTDRPATSTSTEVPQVVATSRGPDLEATDPSTVSLKSGGLHFVEFFRFT